MQVTLVSLEPAQKEHERTIGSNYRRKFRRQTSDSIDRWKAEVGRVREEKESVERRSEKSKIQNKEDAGTQRVESHDSPVTMLSTDLWLWRVEG